MNSVNEMPEDELRAKLLGSLAKSGYPLEMRVAAMARAFHPGFVSQSRYYADPTTGTLRETDILVSWRKKNRSERALTFLYLAMECKSAIHPWVIFDNDQTPFIDSSHGLALTPTRFEPEGDEWLEDRFEAYCDADPLDEGTLFSPRSYPAGYGIVERMLNADKQKGSDTNNAWAATQAAVSAAYGLLAGTNKTQSSQRMHLSSIVVPVAITSGPLFRCWLDGDGEIDIKKTDRASVHVGLSAEARSVRCLVVTEQGVESLLEDAVATIKIFE